MILPQITGQIVFGVDSVFGIIWGEEEKLAIAG